MRDALSANDFAHLAAWPKVQAVSTMLKAQFPFMSAAGERMWTSCGPIWACRFEAALSALNTADDLATAVNGYVRFALESQRLQHAFFKTGDYAARSFQQAAEAVYMNEGYMQRQYLPGLLLSHFLWRHHYDLLCFFERSFLTQMKNAAGGSCLDFIDIGIGTGLYSKLILTDVPESRGLGLDLSPTAKAFTEHQIASIGAGDRYRIRLTDILTAEDVPSTRWLISVELLEHLDDPVAFLRRVAEALAPDGKAFLVAALNSPHPDHIYLYRTPQEVRSQAESVGLNTEQTFSAIAPGHRKGGPGAPEVAALVVSRPSR